MPTLSKNPHAVALGRLGGVKGGRVKSERKTKAARRNGLRGGRPKSPERRAAEAAGVMHKLTVRQTQRIVDMLMDRDAGAPELATAFTTARKLLKTIK